MDRFALTGLILALALPLHAAGDPPSAAPSSTPAAVASPAAPSEPTAPVAEAPVEPLAPAQPLSGSAEAGSATAASVSSVAMPALAEPLSPSAASDEPMIPEEVEDPMALGAQAPVADLKPLGSGTLAKLAKALGSDEDSVWMDPETHEVVESSSDGAARVDAVALYGELAQRMAQADDKDARAALSLAILKKDPRAKEAKDLAYEAKLADSLIALADKGDAKAKAQLQGLALKGNRRARQYLGLDAAPEAAPAAAALSPTTQALPDTETPRTGGPEPRFETLR